MLMGIFALGSSLVALGITLLGLYRRTLPDPFIHQEEHTP